MTVNACSAFPSKTLFDTLEDGTVLLGFTIEHINYAQRIVTMKEFISSAQVFWETTQDGKSVVVVQNLGGDKEDQIFKDFFDTLQKLLITEINNVVDLTVLRKKHVFTLL